MKKVVIPDRTTLSPQQIRAEQMVSSKRGTWFILNVLSRIDPLLMRLSGGRINSLTLAGVKILLLSTTGAKSGLKRSVALVYFTDGERVVLIGSNGGEPKHPAWIHNLRANPNAEILVDGETIPVLAHEADGEERERLWAMAVRMYNGYAVYQERTGPRRIPVMVLTPQGAHSPDGTPHA